MLFDFFDKQKLGVMNLGSINFLLSKSIIGLAKLSEEYDKDTSKNIIKEIDHFVKLNYLSDEKITKNEFQRWVFTNKFTLKFLKKWLSDIENVFVPNILKSKKEAKNHFEDNLEVIITSIKNLNKVTLKK